MFLKNYFIYSLYIAKPTKENNKTCVIPFRVPNINIDYFHCAKNFLCNTTVGFETCQTGY